MTRVLGILLAVSLMLNLAVAGAAIGFFWSDRGQVGADARGSGSNGKQGRGNGQRGGPPILGAFLSGLEKDERRALLRELRDAHAQGDDTRVNMNDLRGTIAAALTQDPLDRAAIADALAVVRQDMAGRSEVTNRFIVDWLSQRSVEDRAKIAQALLSRRK